MLDYAGGGAVHLVGKYHVVSKLVYQMRYDRMLEGGGRALESQVSCCMC